MSSGISDPSFKIISIMILTSILLASISSASFRVTNVITKPEQPEPGDRARIILWVENLGEKALDSVALVRAPEEIELEKSRFYLGDIYEGGWARMEIPARIAENAGSGYYRCELEIHYKDEDGNERKDKLDFEIPIAGTPSLSVRVIENRFVAGEDSELVLSIENLGRGEARNIRLRLGDGILRSRISEFFIPSLNSGERTIARIPVSVDSNAPIGTQRVSLDLEYEQGIFSKPREKTVSETRKKLGDLQGESVLESLTESYTLSRTTRLALSIPIVIEERLEAKLLVSSVETEPRYPEPGEPFTLRISLRNDGNAEARNVEIFLNSTIGGISVYEGGSKRFIDSIPSGSSRNISFELISNEDLESGTYWLSLSGRYSDISERAFHEIVGVNIRGRPKIVLGSVTTDPDRLTPLSEAVISIQLENVGREDAKSVVARIELPRGMRGEEVSYVGGIDRDDTGTAVFDVNIGDIPAGDYEIPLEVEYLDPYGRSYRYSASVTISIVSPVKKGLPTRSLAIGIILFVVSLALGYYLGRRRSLAEET